MTSEEFKRITGKEVEDVAQFTGDPNFLLTLCGVIHGDGKLEGTDQLAAAYNTMLNGDGGRTEEMVEVGHG